MLDMKEIKGMDDKAINSKISELKTELFTMRMEGTASGMEKPHRVKFIKKDIARLNTQLNAKGGK
jgi:large subunit ribosomal protein L29